GAHPGGAGDDPGRPARAPATGAPRRIRAGRPLVRAGGPAAGARRCTRVAGSEKGGGRGGATADGGGVGRRAGTAGGQGGRGGGGPAAGQPEAPWGRGAGRGRGGGGGARVPGPGACS